MKLKLNMESSPSSMTVAYAKLIIADSPTGKTFNEVLLHFKEESLKYCL